MEEFHLIIRTKEELIQLHDVVGDTPYTDHTLDWVFEQLGEQLDKVLCEARE